jgi:thiol-disulfide isomerase/thioredoxin
MRRSLVLVMGVLALGVLAPSGCGSDEPRSAGPPDPAALTGAPAPLAALHKQANRLLGGGPKAFKRRLKGLRGHPVVVNKWASWCPPCRAEFPFFQRQAVKLGKQVAFLGVDSDDNDGDAREFLREFPVSYPSYRDPTLAIAAVFKGVQAFPTTAFYDRRGELAYVHQGGYAAERKLAEDIERYAR